MNADALISGFAAALGLWITPLLIGAVWRIAARILRS